MKIFFWQLLEQSLTNCDNYQLLDVWVHCLARHPDMNRQNSERIDSR